MVNDDRKKMKYHIKMAQKFMDKDKAIATMSPEDAIKYLIDLRNNIKSYDRKKALEEKILVYLENHPEHKDNVSSVDDEEWKWVEAV